MFIVTVASDRQRCFSRMVLTAGFPVSEDEAGACHLGRA